jgi:hypothetical protein
LFFVRHWLMYTFIREMNKILKQTYYDRLLIIKHNIVLIEIRFVMLNHLIVCLTICFIYLPMLKLCPINIFMAVVNLYQIWPKIYTTNVICTKIKIYYIFDSVSIILMYKFLCIVIYMKLIIQNFRFQILSRYLT